MAGFDGVFDNDPPKRSSSAARIKNCNTDTRSNRNVLFKAPLPPTRSREGEEGGVGPPTRVPVEPAHRLFALGAVSFETPPKLRGLRP